jgi:hypothetical protein
MNGSLFGIPFWLIVAGGLGYLMLRKKQTRIGPTRLTPYTKAEYEAAKRQLEVPYDAPEEAIWGEEPASVLISYEAEQAAQMAPIEDVTGIETLGPGMGW